MKNFLATLPKIDIPSRALFTKEVLWRYIFLSLIYYTLGFILGIAIFIIFVGFRLAILRLSFYWTPTNRIINYLLKITKAKTTITIYPRQPWYGYIALVINTIMSIWIIGFGISMLLISGFCGQNLFC